MPAVPPPLLQPPPPSAAEPEPLDHWLEEVRAQRRAWEERRRAQKEAMDARRRWIDPWGAAQQEAREQEVNRRREEFRDRIERSREAFLQQPPWGSPSAQGPDGSQPAPRDPEAPTEGGLPAIEPYPPLPGWDNRWYYRGY
jgi:hypothetical protein